MFSSMHDRQNHLERGLDFAELAGGDHDALLHRDQPQAVHHQFPEKHHHAHPGGQPPETRTA